MNSNRFLAVVILKQTVYQAHSILTLILGGWVIDCIESILWEPRGWWGGGGESSSETRRHLIILSSTCCFPEGSVPPSSLSGILTFRFVRARITKFISTWRKYFPPKVNTTLNDYSLRVTRKIEESTTQTLPHPCRHSIMHWFLHLWIDPSVFPQRGGEASSLLNPRDPG